MSKVLRISFAQLAIVIAGFGASLAMAQDYPNRPIRFVVPVSPGAVQDTVARALSVEMSKFLGQPIVVENKTGANQVIALEHVARQVPADGYSVAVVLVPALATLALTAKDLRFDPLQDLPPIIGLVEGKFVLGTSAQSPWKTLDQLVAHARANPGKLNYGTSAPSTQLLTEALLQAIGISVTHIPYAASGAYVTALLSGEIQMGFIGEAQAISLGDRFRVLGVTGQQRSTIFRDAPTFAELRHPQIEGVSISLNVRAGTPKAVVDKLHAAASQALQQQDIKDRFGKIQLEIVGQTPEAAAKSLADQARLFADIARKIGFKAQ